MKKTTKKVIDDFKKKYNCKDGEVLECEYKNKKFALDYNFIGMFDNMYSKTVKTILNALIKEL